MPGLILIPSDLRILTEPIPGFSNVLTLARNGMTFGKNGKINVIRTEPKPNANKPEPQPSVQKEDTTISPPRRI
jgi:hypothetical protein